MSPKRVEALVWILIYGGLLMAALGLFVGRLSPDDGHGLPALLMASGGVATAVGIVLIVVRARMREPGPAPRPGQEPR